MLKETIQNFPQQLGYEPIIENIVNFDKKDRFIVCGMGGSNLAAGIIKSWKSKLGIVIHRDYGLPEMEDTELRKYLIIASSYSGNTEETISAYEEALARNLPLIVITTGGRLLESAQKNNTPYIQLPDINSNPRFAVGFSIKATLKAMSESAILNDISGEAVSFDATDYEKTGKALAAKLKNRIPLIYSSGTNAGLGRYWKISFNETAKIPAFYNFLPEFNHNEMTGFDLGGSINDKFTFIFLNDPDDEPKIQKRIAITQKIFEKRGLEVLLVDIVGPSLWHKSFAGILTAMWASYYLADHYGVDPEDVSTVENFKKSLTAK